MRPLGLPRERLRDILYGGRGYQGATQRGATQRGTLLYKLARGWKVKEERQFSALSSRLIGCLSAQCWYRRNGLYGGAENTASKYAGALPQGSIHKKRFMAPFRQQKYGRISAAYVGHVRIGTEKTKIHTKLSAAVPTLTAEPFKSAPLPSQSIVTPAPRP